MPRRNFVLIVILMTTAIIGLVAFQWYWVSNYFDANKRELDWEINRALAKTSERYLESSISQMDNYLWRPDSIGSTNSIARKSFHLYNNSLYSNGTDTSMHPQNSIQAMGADYMNKVSGLINNLLTKVNHPKVIDFDRLISILDEELKGVGIDNEYNLAISNINNKVIYYKDPETLQATVMFGYKSPVILSSISNPYFSHLYIYHKGKLLLQKTWIVLLSSMLLVVIILACFAYALHIIFDQKKVSEIKNDFVNNMTHELKTPISTVSLALEAMDSFDVRKDEQRTLKYLDISRREIRRLSTMVEKVLNIARYEKGEIDLKKEHYSINKIIENVVDTISMQVHKKRGSLESNLLANPDTVFVDKVHINSLLYNLIDNSNKYFVDKPEIRIGTRNVLNGIEIEVADKGMGISKEHQKRIFEKFYRVPTGNIHNVKGYGLGLSYVKDIVDMHGGSLKVKSEKNKGTTFIIYLPNELEN